MCDLLTLGRLELTIIRQEYQKKRMVRLQTTAMLSTRREITNVMPHLIKRTKGGLRRWKGSTNSEWLAVFGALRKHPLVLFVS